MIITLVPVVVGQPPGVGKTKLSPKRWEGCIFQELV
jgi:hypothetical protein